MGYDVSGWRLTKIDNDRREGVGCPWRYGHARMVMNFRIAGIVHDSIVDGPGLRTAVFFQGCAHGCEGCFNRETWDFAGGSEVSVDEVLARIDANPLTDGVTLTGGDPLYQPGAARELAKACQDRGLNVWLFTGFRWEEITGERAKVLKYVNTLVDGPFVLAQRTLDASFRGSANQRVIDVSASLWSGRVVTVD